MRSQPPPSLATLRVVITAMIIGACIFGGTVIFSATRMGGRILAEPVIGYVIVAFALLDLLIVFVVVPSRMPKPPANANDLTLLKAFGSQVITQAAMLEALLVFCFVFYLITHDAVILGTGVALTLAMIFLRPNDETFRTWRSRLAE